MLNCNLYILHGLLIFIFSPGLHVIHIATEMEPVAKVHSLHPYPYVLFL
ncbi:hypothetical protein GLYMA_08G234001v4 [Glycine max]|nr:hypothetical protein GLYMA_08G234001v4 [Glycine max]KAH1052715.1 hypothetical protein GYH30_022161 [Glycine max]